MSNPLGFFKKKDYEDSKDETEEKKVYTIDPEDISYPQDNSEDDEVIYDTEETEKEENQAEEVEVKDGKVAPKEEVKPELKKHFQSQSVTHICKNGQKLSTIAKMYGVSEEEIKESNDLKSDKLQPRQKLKININK